MVARIQQLVTVEEGGIIRLTSTDLTPGTQVMVSVEPCVTDDENTQALLNTLNALRSSLNLSPEQAEAWRRHADEERKAAPAKMG